MLPIVPAAIVFSFDPILSVGGFSVRWETIGVAVAAFAAIVVSAGLIARATPLNLRSRPTPPAMSPAS